MKSLRQIAIGAFVAFASYYFGCVWAFYIEINGEIAARNGRHAYERDKRFPFEGRIATCRQIQDGLDCRTFGQVWASTQTSGAGRHYVLAPKKSEKIGKEK